MAETQPLEVFLAGLPEENAAEARVAAARIDALEREIGPPGWIERNLIVLALVSAVLFVAGAGGLLGIFAWGRAIFGLGGITLMVSAFPGLILAYLLSVRGRTGADAEKMDLNTAHFMPHGGAYFGGGRVVRVDWKPREMNLRDQVQARYDAATKRW
jgi:hypothetical protein